MWRYIILLAVFDVGEGGTIWGMPNSPFLRTLSSNPSLHIIVALGFLLAGLACLVEVIYRFARRGESRDVLLARFLVQGFSLILAFIWCLAMFIGWLAGTTTFAAVYGWMFLSVGQALMMIRPLDAGPRVSQEAEELRQVIDQQKVER